MSKISDFLNADEIYKHFIPKAFTRNGKITPRSLIINDLLSLNSSANSSRRNLRDDFGIHSPVDGKDSLKVSVCASAICRARAKILPSLWRHINCIILGLIAEGRFKLQTFKGYPVRAADGSALCGNQQIINSFIDGLSDQEFARLEQEHPEVYENAKQVLLLMVYDPLNRLQLGHVVSLPHKGERELLTELLDLLKAGELLVLDRGYPASWLFYLLQRRGIEFVTRIKSDHCKAVRAFVDSADTERDIELAFSPEARRHLQLQAVEPPACGTVKIRLIKHFKDGHLRVLATSLPADAASVEELGDLYSGRWEIEKAICTFKLPLNLEGWRSYTQAGVDYDIGCKTVAHNLMRVLSWEAELELAQQTRPSGHVAKVNCTFALGELKTTLLPILRDRPPLDVQRQLLKRYHLEILAAPSVIDPKRKNPLKKTRSRPNGNAKINRKPAYG